MRKLVFALAATFLLVAAKEASASIPIGLTETVSTLVRYERALDPHGIWVHTPRYGAVWVPSLTEVGIGWTPYSRGRWLLDGEHWTWQSDFAWGEIAEHHGRWIYDEIHQWAWVPGTAWAPAHVAWRGGNGLIGWAPLDPQDHPAADPEAWTFVDAAALAAGDIAGHRLPPLAAREVFAKTAPLGCEPQPLYALGLAPQSCPNRELRGDHLAALPSERRPLF